MNYRHLPRHAINHHGGIIDLSQFRKPYNSEMQIGSGESPSRKAVNDETLSKLKRIAPEKLELAFYTDPILFAGVRWYQSMIDATRAEIFSARPRTQRAIDDFLGTALRFDDVFFYRVPVELGLYGRSFVEYVKNASGTKIVGFNTGDPKIMDFVRENEAFGDGEVIENGIGLPSAYIQRLSSGTIGGKFVPDRIFRPGIDMKYLFLMQTSTVEHGLGFVEALYQDINLKENVERAATAQAFNAGFPKPIITYGNQLIDPADDLKLAADQLGEDLSNDKMDWASTPFGLTLDFFKTEDVGQNTIEYLREIIKAQAGVLGIPLPFLVQSGAEVGRTTMETLMNNLIMMFRAFQRRLVLHEVVTDVLRFNGRPHLNVGARYGPLGLHELQILSQNLLRVFKAQTPALKDELMSDSEWRQQIDRLAGIRDYENVVGIEVVKR